MEFESLLSGFLAFIEPAIVSFNTDWVVTLFAAIIFGAIVGAERSRVGKRAGMRTFALVSLGAAMFVLVSIEVTNLYVGLTVFDPLRVASQIVVGIGFIGGGVIFVDREDSKGVTTAAGMWVAAAIGMATGFGLYWIAFIAAILTLFVFQTMWRVEHKYIREQVVEHPLGGAVSETSNNRYRNNRDNG